MTLGQEACLKDINRKRHLLVDRLIGAIWSKCFIALLTKDVIQMKWTRLAHVDMS